MIRTSLVAATLVAAVILVAACGGGGGGDGERPSVHHDIAGVDQGIGSLRRLPAVGERGGATIRYGTLSDGVSRETLVRYLHDASAGPAMRYPTPPVVRVIGGASSQNMDRVREAVRLVNLALPLDARMTVGVPLPSLSLTSMIDHEGYIYWSSRALNNTIHVEFSPCAEYHSCGTSGGTTWNYPWTPGTATQRTYIQMNRDAAALTDDRLATILLAHELMHALGLYGGDHVSPEFDSIMLASGIYETEQGIPQPATYLYPVDREALRALYSRFNAGDNFDSLGAWSSTSTHFIGDGQHVDFGVALRNGYAEPWARGVRPSSALGNNRALSGTATWRGALLGFSGRRPVAGDAEIAVELAVMTGTAAFTELEYWHHPEAEDPLGGTMWGDGDLGYTITVTGNTFRETGGDDGTLTGIFTGAAHEGAAGTLERTDLTAAFGTIR